MEFERRFGSSRKQFEFEFSEPEPELCEFAQKFSEWTQPLVENAVEDGHLVALNQAKVLLIDKYFEWHAFVPKKHRTISTGSHIFGLLTNGYGSTEVELSAHLNKGGNAL